MVPRRHARDLWEISEEAYGHVSRTVHRVAALLKAALAPDGVNVNNSTGEAAGQEVFHVHIHVVPRWHGDSLRPMWSASRASTEELERVRSRVTAIR